ncbi:MAG: hypothetical protein K6E47_13100 [Lachnospiraceae bacterium]|nr:hypothetical protein [Lachnospiraceae bacterium]
MKELESRIIMDYVATQGKYKIEDKALDHGINREGTLDLVIDDAIKEDFERRRDIFCSGQAKHLLFANENAARTLPPFSFSGSAHNTFYTISNQGQGIVLSEIERQELTLNVALKYSVITGRCIHVIYKSIRKRGYFFVKHRFSEIIYTYNIYIFYYYFIVILFKSRTYWVALLLLRQIICNITYNCYHDKMPTQEYIICQLNFNVWQVVDKIWQLQNM